MSGGLLSGRLGLAESRVPHADRHGLLWLERGQLSVENGTLHFSAANSALLDAGQYDIPYQSVSMILLGPGSTISHDALRLLARHSTLLTAVGEGGVKFYTAPPMGQGHSDVARAHAHLWADEKARLEVARRMYIFRFGQILPHRDITVLRGIEGGRMKKSYQILAEEHGVPWKGRRYDRQNPTAADIPNQAINHAASFTEAAARYRCCRSGRPATVRFHPRGLQQRLQPWISLTCTGWSLLCHWPSPSRKGYLTIRTSCWNGPFGGTAARQFRKQKLIPKMIDRIKELIHVDDRGSDT